MRVIYQLIRLFVGSLFILSGLIKLNDPLGFSYKLEEYFSEQVFNIEWLMPFVLPIALGIVIIEIIFGILLLFGIYRRFTLIGLLIIIVFFSFLTFYSAYFDKVTDCGCFGDAIPLTPWQSFIKDLVLLFLILFLLKWDEYLAPLFSKKVGMVLLFAFILFSGWLGYHVLYHLPVLDFRPYRIGVNIMDNMSIPAGAPKAKYEITYIYLENGKEKKYVSNGPAPKVNGELIKVDTKEIDPGYSPPIHDFTMEDAEGNNLTENLLSIPKLYLVVSYDLIKADPQSWELLRSQIKEAQSKGYTTVLLTASYFQDGFFEELEVLSCDETALKTIVRANPGILQINKGTVIDKRGWRDAIKMNL